MSFGIILATHGNIGVATLEAAEMLTGKQERVRALMLTADKSVETFESEFISAYKELSAAYDYVVALCDIYGGSPFNVISRAKLSGYNVLAFTGLSLPVLIDLLFAGSLSIDGVRKHVLAAHDEALKEIKATVVEAADKEDFDL